MTPNPDRETTREDTEVTIWDENEKKAILNLLPEKVTEKLRRALKTAPHLFKLDHQDLYHELRTSNKTPTAIDNRLRLQFWLEYDRAIQNNHLMSTRAIYVGVCHSHYFYDGVLESPWKVAWILNPPSSYIGMINEVLDFGMQKMREILDLPITDAKGKVNTRLGMLQAKIVAMVDMRKQGAFTQKIENKSVSLQLMANTATEKDVNQFALDHSMRDVDKRIRQLQRELKELQHVPENADAIEVTSTVVTTPVSPPVEPPMVSPPDVMTDSLDDTE